MRRVTIKEMIATGRLAAAKALSTLRAAGMTRSLAERIAAYDVARMAAAMAMEDKRIEARKAMPTPETIEDIFNAPYSTKDEAALHEAYEAACRAVDGHLLHRQDTLLAALGASIDPMDSGPILADLADLLRAEYPAPPERRSLGFSTAINDPIHTPRDWKTGVTNYRAWLPHEADGLIGAVRWYAARMDDARLHYGAQATLYLKASRIAAAVADAEASGHDIDKDAILEITERAIIEGAISVIRACEELEGLTDSQRRLLHAARLQMGG